MKTIDRMTTTTIIRCACYMQPDSCPEEDYRITGTSVHGDPFDVLVHHRCRGCWKAEEGELREQWLDFSSLRDVIAYLEDPLS